MAADKPSSRRKEEVWKKLQGIVLWYRVKHAKESSGIYDGYPYCFCGFRQPGQILLQRKCAVAHNAILEIWRFRRIMCTEYCYRSRHTGRLVQLSLFDGLKCCYEQRECTIQHYGIPECDQWELVWFCRTLFNSCWLFWRRNNIYLYKSFCNISFLRICFTAHITVVL